MDTIVIIVCSSLGAMLIGNIIAGLLYVGGLRVRVNDLETEHKELKDDLDQDIKELKEIHRNEIDRFKTEFRTWKETHEKDSLQLHTNITRLETKLNSLIDRIDRAGINGRCP